MHVLTKGQNESVPEAHSTAWCPDVLVSKLHISIIKAPLLALAFGPAFTLLLLDCSFSNFGVIPLTCQKLLVLFPIFNLSHKRLSSEIHQAKECQALECLTVNIYIEL